MPITWALRRAARWAWPDLKTAGYFICITAAYFIL
jgi:hypothetical protein